MLASRRAAPGDTGPDAAHFHHDESSFEGPWFSVPLPYLARSLCLPHFPKESDLPFCSLSPYTENQSKEQRHATSTFASSQPPPLHPLPTTKSVKKPGQESDPESRTAIVPENKHGGRGRPIRPNTSLDPKAALYSAPGRGRISGDRLRFRCFQHNQSKHLFPGRDAARGRRESRGTAGRTR